MKKLKNIVEICHLAEKCVNYLEKHCATRVSYQNFMTRKIKMKNSSSDVWNKQLLKLKNILTETGAYVPV